MLPTFFILELAFLGTYAISGLVTYLLDTKTNIERIDKNKPKTDLIQTYKKIYPNVLFNLLITNTLLFYSLSNYINILNKDFTLPSFILDSLLIYGLIDVVFYSLHRLLHHRWFYRYHKKHHELLDPIGIGAVYSHPIDFIVGLTLPVILPCILVSAHLYTVLFILTVSVSNSIIVSHSGYNIFAIKKYNPHHIHHTKFKYNYGTMLFMDKLFGTDK